MTDMYFLLAQEQMSRFHRIKHDEIWHFYEGDPLKLHMLSPDLQDYRCLCIGDRKGRIKYKAVVPANYWQAAHTTGGYSLVACTVAPGFDFQDFEFLKDNKEFRELVEHKYPQLQTLI